LVTFAIEGKLGKFCISVCNNESYKVTNLQLYTFKLLVDVVAEVSEGS